MKIIDMSRKEARFWSMNILLGLLGGMAVYAFGHMEVLVRSIPLPEKLLNTAFGTGCDFAISWLLVFTCGYLFRDSWHTLKKGFTISAAIILILECVKLFVFQPSLALGGLFAAASACVLAILRIMVHERVLV